MTAILDIAPAAPRVSRVLHATPWIAAVWAATFLPLALLAVLDRTGHPWSPEAASALGGMTAREMSWVLVGVATLALGALAAGTVSRARSTLRTTGWVLVVLGVVVTVAISDVRALAFLGYLPMTVLAIVGVGPAAGHVDASVFVDSAAAVGHAVGGVALAVVGVGMLDRAGRLRDGRGTSWRAWVRWGRPAAAVAAAVPLVYAVTRLAWALDIPLGVRRSMLDDLGSARYAGLGLALFAVAGAWLTTGLVARWGEVFWDWVPRAGGRPVPIGLALVPGLLVAGAVLSAGLSFWRLLVAGELSSVPGAEEDWAAWAPELLWPVWGVALAVACLAYLGRRTS